MNNFFNILDNYIVILDKKLEVKFCNKKFLEDSKINSDEINKIILDISSEEELLKKLDKEECLELELKLFYKTLYIKFDSKIIKQIIEEKEVYLISGINMKKVEFDDTKGIVEDNISNKVQKNKNNLDILNDILSNIKNGSSIEDAIKNINIEELINEIIEDIKRNDLIQKDFKLFLSISADLVGGLDKNFNMILVDYSWTKTLGWETEEIINKNILDYIHPSQKELLKEALISSGTDTSSVECKIRCKNGKYKWLRWNIKLVKEVSLIAITIRDIHREKEEEKVRKKLEEKIQMESIKNKFFTNLSHEFRTPLNIILGTIQLIERNISIHNEDYKNNIKLEGHVKLIKQNAYRLLKLVNNLIDITRIDAGYYNLELGNYNIVNIVEDISLSVADYAKEKDITLIFDTDFEECIIACDPEKIERILLNLLSNAIKNTSSGGNILVCLKSSKEYINVIVKDSGKGIPKDKLPIIFNRFVQVDSSLSRRYEGSGIGLSLVKSLVNMHGGDIKVESQINKGSEFIFTLQNKTIDKKIIKVQDYNSSSNKIEKCNIEFSDIYK